MIKKEGLIFILFISWILLMPISNTFAASKGDPVKGKRIFQYYCALCHGETGKGDGINAFTLDPKPRDFTDDEHMSRLVDEDFFEIIHGGGPNINRSVLMPPWGRTIPKERIWDLIAYIKTLFTKVELPGLKRD